MSNNEKFKKKNHLQIEADADDDDQSSGSSGGKTGQIEFHDFIGTGAETRDDLLSYDKKKQLLLEHQALHEFKVKQQKEKRELYQNLKNGKTTLQAFRENLMQLGREAVYKAFPALRNKAQFSGGIDINVNSVPTEFVAETNHEKQLQNQPEPQLRYQPQAQPTFNPKPRGPG